DTARQCFDVVAGSESHVVEVRADARRDRWGTHAVDEIDDGDVPKHKTAYEIVQTVRGDGPKDYRLSAATDTFGDLSPLRLQMFVTAGLEDIEPHAEARRLLDQG